MCENCYPEWKALRAENEALSLKLDTMTQARVGDIKEIERLIRERGILAGERDGYRLQAECMTRERDGFCEAFKASEKERHDALLQVESARAILTKLNDCHGRDVAVNGDHPEFCDCAWCHLWGEVRAFLHPGDYPEKRVDPAPANWDKIIGALPDLPDHPELLKVHPLTCGECRAEIRTDICPECAERMDA